ncbi:uncharacterized protein LOC107725701 isoform X1 [Sinocyclocheilus rhinocerous]|uniref:uncharacterized protein LOC107725701 isoform X1 n=1 Tax=Sinocyclocheilus rhinocerous TaxID=307959 RepID=UPI0007B9B00E|nr:PREDICTED: uncharacterized protein LOC107725701 isoform X1 [Sinocyclocheilus rhinocerous]
MKPHTSVVRRKLMSLPTEAPLIIQDITDARPTHPSNYISSPPVFGCSTAAESRLNAFSATQKCPCSPSDSRDLKPHSVSSITKGTLLPFLAKNSSNVTSQNNVYDSDISGRHFLFDKQWRNGTYITIGIEDDVLINHNPTNPLSQEFHVYRSHNLTRFAHRKELCPRDPRPLICGSDYLASFPSVLLPATTPSVSGRLCLSQNYKNRLRMKNRARYLFSDGANNKTQSYPDPHLGASASFVQRLTEISSLEAETVRQERMKRLKKINRQDS